MNNSKSTLLAASLALVSLCPAKSSAEAQYTVLHNFAGGDYDGANPYGGLILVDDRLYGMTSNGGDDLGGVIFSLQTDGTGFEAIYSLQWGIYCGHEPRGDLVFGGTKLYGLTRLGGEEDHGTIFSVQTNGDGYELLDSFRETMTVPDEGRYPCGSLRPIGGLVGGMTSYGGEYGHGTIFAGPHIQVWHNFSTADGTNPLGSLVCADTTFYGMAQSGGSSDCGTVFSIMLDLPYWPPEFTLLHSFTGDDGMAPTGSLVLGGTTLYGMASSGGELGYGTIFSLQTDGSGFTILHDFISGTGGGESPQGSLTLNGDALYGMTYSGGSTDAGTIFYLGTDGSSFRLLHSFGGGDDGEFPHGDLILDDNTLYGMTYSGGTSDLGVIFSFQLPSPTPTPVGYKTPTPSPSPTTTPPSPTPSPSPDYCNSPLKIADLENMVLAHSRAVEADGWRWIILKAQNPTAEGKGQIYDNDQVYIDYNDEPVARAIKLVIQQGEDEIDVRKGDYVTITYDSGQSVSIYPPAIYGLGTYTYYVDEAGNTYTDVELCSMVGSAPTPTPSATATPITPTPTPFGFHSPTATPTPEGYLTPTPTPEGYLTPSPTPAYCNNPLLVADLENMTLAHSRAANVDGWRWRILKAQNPTDEGKGQIYDNGQVYSDYSEETIARPIKLIIQKWANELDVRKGDYTTITYDSGQSTLIYPPAIFGTGTLTFYVDEDGRTYTDLELCNLVGTIPTPTPLGYKTPTVTPTPYGFKSPTPSPTAIPTPSVTATPVYCHSPMTVADLENMTLAHSRAANVDGWRWIIFKAQNPTTTGKGQIYDNGQVYTDYDEEAIARPIKVVIQKWANEINVQTGDYTTITYDSGQSALIYPPAISGTGTYTFYVDEAGNTYTDLELCSLAGSVSTPTPSPTPTPFGFKTPTPTSTPSRTPSPTPTNTPTPTPTPTPFGFKTPTAVPTLSPTPGYCRLPLIVKNPTNLNINTTRSSVPTGWRYNVYAFDDLDAVNGGTCVDNDNNYSDYGDFNHYRPLALRIKELNETVAIQAGDILTLDYDGSSIDLLLPAVGGLENMPSKSTYYYFASDGSSYLDVELCQIAQGTPTSTPAPSPSTTPSTTPTKTPTPEPTPTPTPSSSPTSVPTNPPTPVPTSTPIPTTTPTSEPTKTPTPRPTCTSSPSPTATPAPSATPSLPPTASPSRTPTASPTPTPSITPTPSQTVTPSFTPSPTPTNSPTPYPSITPPPSPSPTPTPSPVPSPTVAPAPPAAIGDYNGDGTSDIAVFRPSSGLWLVRSLTKAWFGAGSDEVVPNDYNGDGIWEVAVFRPSNGKWLVRGVTNAFYGVSTDLPVPGDYDGDGSADIALFRPSIGKWLVRGGLQTYYGFSTDVLVPADYGGDGTTDIAVFRPSNGKWLIRGLTSAYYGFATDTVVPGDYTGEGAADMAVFRPSNGKWLVRGGPTAYFGNSSDTVQPADYDGDGTWDFAVFRSASGKWLVRGVTAPYYGSSTDHPVTNP